MPDNGNGDRNLEDLTIRDLFALSPDGPSELAAGLEAKDYPAIEKAVSALSEPIPWSRVQSEMSGLFSAALNTSLLDAWACAWKKYQDLKSDIEKSRKSPGAVVLAGLAKHSINSALHPYIEVSLGPKVVQKITFDVTLTTQLEGVVLGLKAGRLVSIQIASCEWTGSIATHGATFVKRKLARLNFPGRIDLKRGIAMGPQGDN